MAEKLNLKKLAFIGGGAMGEAIIKGITGASLMDPAAVFVGAHRQERADYLHETYGVTGLVDNQEAVRDADMVVLAIKPQMVDSVLDAKLAAAVNKNAVILSIMGSVTIEKIAGIFKGHSIIRTMPNTPLAVGAGMTAIAAGEGVPEEAVQAAEQIFGVKPAIEEEPTEKKCEKCKHFNKRPDEFPCSECFCDDTRFEKAVDEAVNLVDDSDGASFTVISCGGNVDIKISNSKNRTKVKEILKGLKCTDEASNLTSAYEVVKTMRETGGDDLLHVIIFTDGSGAETAGEYVQKKRPHVRRMEH